MFALCVFMLVSQTSQPITELSCTCDLSAWVYLTNASLPFARQKYRMKRALFWKCADFDHMEEVVLTLCALINSNLQFSPPPPPPPEHLTIFRARGVGHLTRKVFQRMENLNCASEKPGSWSINEFKGGNVAFVSHCLTKKGSQHYKQMVFSRVCIENMIEM